MKQCILLLLWLTVYIAPFTFCAETPVNIKHDWNIQEVYNFLGTLGDELSKEEIDEYCRFIINCQDPETGNFKDTSGKAIYSVKAFYRLRQFGYEAKYPLGVCSGTDEDWGQIEGKPVTEYLSPEEFRKWLEKIYVIEDAYAAGSSIGHFRPGCQVTTVEVLV